MRLVSISLKGYRQFLERTDIAFPTGLTGICGDNGVGKSKLIEAIGYALFGPFKGFLPTSDKEPDVASAAGEGNVLTEVRLEVEVRGQFYRVTRSRKAKECRIELLSPGEGGGPNPVMLATSPSDVTKKVIELFGMTPEAYLRTFVARQKEVTGIQTMRLQDRQKLINRLIGIAQIEKALALAEAERKSRSGKLDEKIAEDGDSADVPLAEQGLELAKTGALGAAVAESERKQRLLEAQRASEAARSAKEDLGQKLAETQVKREEVESLGVVAAGLEKGLVEAQKHRDECLAAANQVAGAESILNETQDIPEQITGFDTLYEIAQLRQTLGTHNAVLARAGEAVQNYHTLNDRLRATRLRVESLQSDVATGQSLLQIARSRNADSERQLVQSTQQLTTVRELGVDGKCDQCGQRLGDNLDVAIERLSRESRDAQTQARDNAEAVKEAKGALEALLKVMEEETESRDALQKQLDGLASVPGQWQLAEARQNEIETALAAFPEQVRDTPYDRAAHATAQQALDRRRAAETTVQMYRQSAEMVPTSQEAVARAEGLCEQNLSRRKILAADLAALSSIEQAVQASQENLNRATTSETEAREQWEAAVTALAQADAGVTTATAKHEEAIRQAERIAALRDSLEIAQRTENILRATRDEITGEACPRITEMIDGWARSLMGAHFNRVQLTPEYKIEADNGSGLHSIEHFSGGEQTLLAVMLRVAISLYCQERSGMGAGFLVLDEVFGDQDELHRAQLVQFLNEIKPHYHQVLIVNHVPDVTDRLGSIIEVTSTGVRTSTASLRI